MNINPFRKTISGLKQRDAMIAWLLQADYSHFVTLNFHAEYRERAAQARLRKWNLNVRSRLFRSSEFENVSREQLFRFIGFPEYAPCTGHIHYHLMANVTEARREWFETSAPKLWKALVPSGTCDVKQIPSTKDKSYVIQYVTKHADRPFSMNGFIASRMLDHPRS